MTNHSTTMSDTFDYLIVGGGIAGASLGFELAPFGRVAILEREEQPGYHATGRSAALFMEGYGPSQVRALTLASREFFEAPPDGFAEYPLLTRRGVMTVAASGKANELAARYEMLRTVVSDLQLLGPSEALALVPVLRPECVSGAIFDPAAADMDVHSILQGYLRGFRRAGGKVICNAEVKALDLRGDVWNVMAAGTEYQAPVVINAAGAWADVVARMAGASPIGLEPRRRSAFVFTPPAGLATAGWPAAGSLSEEWYFKPDAGMLLGSPANADPVPPQDVQPDEIDIALGIHRIEEMTTLTIRRPTRTWAGLRSFVADGQLVGGFDAEIPGFFWLAAQGGYGIQTSAAMAQACCALVRRAPFPERLKAYGLEANMLSPARKGMSLSTGEH